MARKTTFANDARVCGVWDKACEASLIEARDKAVAAGTKAALDAFDKRLDRILANTTMPAHVFARHVRAVDNAWIRLETKSSRSRKSKR